jgi:hypothetical protein
MQHVLTASVQPLRESARLEAAKFAALEASQDDEYMPGGMKPRYFWTSIGLAGGGAGLLTLAALIGAECGRNEDVNCEGGEQAGLLVYGGGLVGAGVVVWILGKRNARAAGNPQLVWTPRGVGFRSQVSF